jgi:RimJ/RimL family protein N-acetyltransferase
MDAFPKEKRLDTKIGTVLIRPGRESDAPAYRELRLEALRNHPEAYSADLAASKARPMEYWTGRLRSLGADAMMVFAVHEDSLIGMCAAFRGDSPKTRHSATLVSVYLQPEWRGMRIADGMIRQCMDWAHAQGVTIVKLAVTASNAEAIRCYTRCGFTVYGTEPQAICVDGVMQDDILMARLL